MAGRDVLACESEGRKAHHIPFMPLPAHGRKCDCGLPNVAPYLTKIHPWESRPSELHSSENADGTGLNKEQKGSCLREMQGDTAMSSGAGLCKVKGQEP